MGEGLVSAVKSLVIHDVQKVATCLLRQPSLICDLSCITQLVLWCGLRDGSSGGGVIRGMSRAEKSWQYLASIALRKWPRVTGASLVPSQTQKVWVLTSQQLRLILRNVGRDSSAGI